MSQASRGDRQGFGLALLALAVLLLATGLVRITESDGPRTPAADRLPSPAAGPPAAAMPTAVAPATPEKEPDNDAGTSSRVQGVFDDGAFLVAYYGTGGTGSLGVLGESRPDAMHQRLMRAARPFARRGRPVVPVYELIVTVADPFPGRDGDYSHDIPRSVVEQYVRASRRNGALLLLDVQPGRSRFDHVVRRWAWALREPHVGLALDPEWRMTPRDVPGRVIGSVGHREVNRTSAWLADLRARHDLPEKLFVLHQFRSDMLAGIGRIRDRRGLAMVQHVDGFGTPAQKRATYRTVARPRQFAMGFKLFYDEDIRRLRAPDVHRLRPHVRFVSFQ